MEKNLANVLIFLWTLFERTFIIINDLKMIFLWQCMNSFPVVATIKKDLFWLMVWNSLRLWQLPYEAACSHRYGPGSRENRAG